MSRRSSSLPLRGLHPCFSIERSPQQSADKRAAPHSNDDDGSFSQYIDGISSLKGGCFSHSNEEWLHSLWIDFTYLHGYLYASCPLTLLLQRTTRVSCLLRLITNSLQDIATCRSIRSLREEPITHPPQNTTQSFTWISWTREFCILSIPTASSTLNNRH